MECSLSQGELIRLDGEEHGVVLRCTSGTIWLTCGDGQDYLLSAGKSFEIVARQVAVAEALHAAECTVAKSESSRKVMPRHAIRFAAC